jgi:glycosyltransferase involved in cell wall biosynthesis
VPDLTAGATVPRVLALGLPRERLRVSVGVLGAATGPAADELRAAGVAVHSVPVRHSLDVGGARRLRRAVRDTNPAVVHAFGPDAARLARLVVSSGPGGGNAPTLVVSGAATPVGGFGGWLTKRLVRRADRVVAETWADGERYRRLGVEAERLTRISPCAPAPAPAPDRNALLESLGVPFKSRVIVVGARSERGVGAKDAIIAFDMLRYDARDLYLVVFGAGSAAATLEGFARSLAFDDLRVRVAPLSVDRASVVRLATAVWITSPSGGTDEALEAMAAGKPVVAWGTPELAEIIDDGATGVLAQLGDRAALATRARALLDDPAAIVRLGEAGRLRAAERFSQSRLIEQFVRVYSELGTA